MLVWGHFSQELIGKVIPTTTCNELALVYHCASDLLDPVHWQYNAVMA